MYTSPIGGAGRGLTTGDFNGDGRIDVIASMGGRLVLWPGNGDGTLGSLTFVGNAYSGMNNTLKAADLNDDGKLDLIVADYYYGVSVFYGNGDGTFGAPQIQGLYGGGYSFNLAVADVDGEGDLDIVSGAAGSSYVSTYINTGGPFASWTTRYVHYVGSDSVNVFVADLNGDGRQDIVATPYGSYAWIVLGSTTDQPGVFASYRGSFPTGYNTEHAAVADLDGDGLLDLISGGDGGAITYGTSTAPYFGTVQHLSMAPGVGATNVQVADLDGDGDLDLFRGTWGARTVEIARNQGDRTFTYETIALPSSLSGYTWDLQTADLDGDGLPEIVGTDGDSRAVYVLRSQLAAPVSTFTLLTNSPPVAQPGGPYTVEFPGAVTLDGSASSDLDGDSLTYVWTFGDGETYSESPSNAPDGVYDGRVQHTYSQLGTYVVSLTTEDGKGGTSTASTTVVVRDTTPPAVIAATPATSGTLHGASFSTIEVTFSEPVTAATAENVSNYWLVGPNGRVAATSVALNDTLTGVIVHFAAQTAGGSYSLRVANISDDHGNAMPDFADPRSAGYTAPTIYHSPSSGLASHEAVGDFDGDGILDLVVQQDGSSNLVLFKGQGGGDLDDGTVIAGAVSGAIVRHMAVGDIDNDGTLDLVLAEAGSGVGILLGNGDGTFQPRQYLLGQYATTAKLADINSDGRLDIITADPGGYVRVFINSGTAAVSSWNVVVSSGPPLVDFSPLDADGDGRMDLVSADVGGTGWVWIGTGAAGQFAAIYRVESSYVRGYERHLLVADIDNDGRADLVDGSGNYIVYGIPSAPYFGTTKYLVSNSGGNATDPTAADLDADGRLDIIKGDFGAGKIFFSYSQGDRTFVNQYLDLRGYGISYIWQLLTPDLNGDGLPDIIGTDYGSNSVFVLKSQVGGALATTFNFVPDAPPAIVGIDPVDPNLRNTQVTSEQVSFSEPIDLTNFDWSAVSLTRNGGPNLIAGGLNISLVAGTTAAYRIDGLGPLTTADGTYLLTIDATHVRSLSGTAGTGTATATWLMDATPPTSKVAPLERRASALTIPVSVIGSDAGEQPSGVTSYDIFVSTDNSPFSYWQTVPASSPATTFFAASGHTYDFRSVAYDAAGNFESKPIAFEATIYVPDLDAPVTKVMAVDVATSVFNINLTGTDSGGSGLAAFHAYVSVDGAPPSAFALVAAGRPSAGIYSGSALYAAMQDDNPHTYRFFTLGVDGNGNAAVSAEADDIIVTTTFSPPKPARVDLFSIQKGAVQRSFIRYIDATISDPAIAQALANSLGDDDATNDRVLLVRYELDGSGGQSVSLKGKAQAVDRLFSLDFGPGGITSGIGGNANSLVGNGYYELDFDLDGDGTFETAKHFYRLAGDVDGNRAVDALDVAAVNAVYGRADASIYEDINGDALVNVKDISLVAKGKGVALSADLQLDA